MIVNEQKRKLLIFTDTYESQLNGVQVSLGELIRHLDDSVKVSIISADRFSTIPCPTYKEIRISVVTPRHMIKIITEEKPDFIHIATEGTVGFSASRACKKLGIPYTSAFHTKFPEYIHMRVPFVQEGWVHKALRYIHDGSTRIFVSNENMRQYLLDNHYTEEKITILPFGVDHTVFYPGQKTLFHNLPRPILLFVGRVAIEKNIGDFLAMENLGTKVVVGDGPLLSELRERFPDVQFLGSQSRESLGEIYRSADIFVFPSLSDTLGLVNVEALACGLPVLAYDVDGPNTIIQSGVNGILIPYGERLESGLEKIVGILRQNCVESVKEYNWNMYASHFLSQQILI